LAVSKVLPKRVFSLLCDLDEESVQFCNRPSLTALPGTPYFTKEIGMALDGAYNGLC
jgi:hypothetical protein